MPLDHTPVYKTKCQQLAEQERARSASPVEPEQAAAPLTEPVVTESSDHGIFWVYSVAPAQSPMPALSRLADHNAGFTGELVPVGPTTRGPLVSGLPDISYGPFSNPTELDFVEWANTCQGHSSPCAPRPSRIQHLSPNKLD